MYSKPSELLRRTKLASVAFFLFLIARPDAAVRVDVLRPVGGLPAHVAGIFEEAASFQQAANGYYFVFDRRAHSIYRIDPDGQTARKVVDIGQEEGRIIQPGG